MVRRLVEHQNIRPGDHHLRQHAADSLASGQYLNLLDAVLTAEEHSSQKAADIRHVLFRRILGQPVYNGIVIVKFRAVVLGEIRLGRRKAPLIASGIRLHFTGQDLEQGCFGHLVGSYQSNLVLSSKGKGNIIQNLYSIDGLRQILHRQDFVSNFSRGTEINIRILPAGGLDLIQLDLFQRPLSGGRLLGLGRVGGKPLNKFLQLLDLFFLLPVRLFHLADH